MNTKKLVYMKEHLQLMSEQLVATKEEITNVNSNLFES